MVTLLNQQTDWLQTYRRLIAALAVAAIAHGVLVAALPLFIFSNQHASLVGWMIACYASGGILTRLVIPRIAGGVSPYLLLRLSGAFLVLAYSAMLFGDLTSSWILVCKFFEGAAFSAFLLIPISWVAENAPTSRKGRYLGIMNAVNAAALATTPPLGLLIYTNQQTFAFLLVGSILSAAFAFAISPRFELAPKSAHEALQEHNNYSFPAILLASAAIASTLGSMEAYYGPLLANLSQLDNVQISICFFAFGVALVFGRAGGGAASDHWGRNRMIFIGVLLLTLSQMSLLFGSGMATALIASSSFGLGFGCAGTGIDAKIADMAAEGSLNLFAANGISYEIGFMLGAALSAIVSVVGIQAIPIQNTLVILLAFAAVCVSVLKRPYNTEGVE